MAMKYEKLQGMDLHYMVRNTNGESNSNSLRLEGVKNAPSRNARIMSNAAGKRLPGTLINYKAFTIPNNNALGSGIEAPQVNEQARIQTLHGSLNIWGTYDDPNFGKIDTDVTSIKSAVFKGTGTGAFKDVGVVKIFYDNDGSVLGKAGLRKLQLFKEYKSSDLDGKYFYEAIDFKGQEYKITEDIITVQFIVPLKDAAGHRGLVSWNALGYPSENNGKLAIQENITISFGTKNNSTTYTGSSLSVSTNGYYDMNESYKFNVSDGDKHAELTIKKVSDNVREIVFKHH